MEIQMNAKIPDTVSYRKLQVSFKYAATENSINSGQSKVTEVSEWAKQVAQILQEITESMGQMIEDKMAKQLMALASFRTHLALSLQVLKAAQL